MATFYNQAAFSYAGGTVNSNVTEGEIKQALTAAKTSLRANYEPNGDVSYVISLTNTGTVAYTGLTVSDNLGAYETATPTTVYPLDVEETSVKYFVNGTEQAPTVSTTQPLVLTDVEVPAGGNTVIVYQARANSFASPETTGSIQNTVTISCGGLTEAVTADATVTPTQQPIISIIKCLSPTTVTENSQVTYTFTVYNSGNTEVAACDNATITDTFSPVLTGITVTLNGQPTTDYTYTEATGVFATNAGAMTVPAATVSQNPATGEYSVVPGTAVLTVTGTIL